MNLSLLALAIAVPAVMLGACVTEPTVPIDHEDTAGPGRPVTPPLDPDDGVAACNCMCSTGGTSDNLCYSQPSPGDACTDSTFTVTPTTTCGQMAGQTCHGFFKNTDGAWYESFGTLTACGYGKATTTATQAVATD